MVEAGEKKALDLGVTLGIGVRLRRRRVVCA